MPVTETFLVDDVFTIPEKVYSMRIRMFGGSGGGEFINNDTALTPTAGTSGGSSSFLGLTTNGGIGGGVGGRNAGGWGGTVSIEYDWTSLGATITSANGNRGQFNVGGNGGSIGGARKDGGLGTAGIFTYASNVTHDYINPPGIHNFTYSSPDLSVGFLGGEGTGYCGTTASHKHYTVRFNIPFVDAQFVVKDIYGNYPFETNFYGNNWANQAAGGSTDGPFTITSGGDANNNSKNTFVRTNEYGWLSFRSDSLAYEIGPTSYNIYTHWSSSTNYSAGQFVIYQSLAYRSRFSSNTGNVPSDSPGYWQELTILERRSYFRLFFCRAYSGSTYIKFINFSTSGQKQGAIGRGGGGGGALETTLTRQMLVDSVTYAPNTTHDVVVGLKGNAGGTNAADGVAGYVELFMYIIPTVTLTSNKYEITLGESARLSWTTVGDADTVTWTSGELTNNNLTSFSDVSPIDTTTYTVVASGLGGSSDPASVEIIVYQPPQASIEVPTQVLYGEDITIGFTTRYANQSITITPYYMFLGGSSEEMGSSVTYSVVANSAEIGSDSDTVVSTDSLTIPIAYDNFGPYQVRMVIVSNGSGGSATAESTIPVIIDQTPDNVVVPETEDKFKDENPVFTPETDILSELILIDGVDIPIEIKANYPIQVDLNQEGIWRNIREI